MEERPIVIDIKNVTKNFGRRTVLNKVSLQIPMGKVCCLLGPNGSGKTTLLKILAGLLTPTEGHVTLMGKDPVKDFTARQMIGWMPAEERSGFYGRLTGRQNLEFFAALYGVNKKEMDRRIGNYAFLLDFDDDVERRTLQTSAGGRQKVALSRALLHDPAILLLDEPMRNLDPHAVKRFRRFIRDHLTRREKKTVFLSTHQLEEARRIADFIVIIKEGEIKLSLGIEDLEKKLTSISLEDFYINIIDKVDN